MNTKPNSSSCFSRWKNLWKIAKGSRFACLAAIVFTAVAAATSYLTPLVVSFTVDSVLDSKPMQLPVWMQSLIEQLGGRNFLAQNLWVCALAVIFVSIINGVSAFLRGKYAAKMGEGVSRSLRNRLFHCLSHATYAWHKASQTGDLIQRCTSDVDTVRRFIQNQLIQVLRTICMAATAISIMLPISPSLTVIATCLLPILVVFSFVYSKNVQKYFTMVDEAEGKLSTALQENLTGMRVVRAFAHQKQELEKYTAFNQSFRKISLKLNSLMALYWGLSDMIGYLQIALVLVAGVFMATQGKITTGNVILFTSYASMLTFPMRNLGRILADLVMAHVSLGRLEEILAAPQETEPGKALCPEIKGDLVFENVCFAYDDDKTEVLHNISFSVKAGQTVGILGSTGAGKSTLVHLLQRLYLPTSGKILLDETEIQDIQSEYLRNHIGIVLQEPFLFSRTIRENITLACPNATQEESFSAARTACIHDVITGFSEGYETIVGERGVTLSGGQKQRIAIARMLVQNTPICIFDDSLSAVDAQTDASIRSALAERNTGTTILISHRISTLKDADLILVLENGSVIQQGSHAELSAQDGLYRRICVIQNELADSAQGGDAV